jgi:hypothetical protein
MCGILGLCPMRTETKHNYTNQSQFEYDWIVYGNKNEGITWSMVILENSNDIINERLNLRSEAVAISCLADGCN